MSEKIDKEAILNDFKEKLYAEIPNFWKANIAVGQTTELEYYSKIIVGQTFCNRQKYRQRQRFIKDLRSYEKQDMGDIKNPPITIGDLIDKWEAKK